MEDSYSIYDVMALAVLYLLVHYGEVFWAKLSKRPQKDEWMPSNAACKHLDWPKYLGRGDLVFWTWGKLTPHSVEPFVKESQKVLHKELDRPIPALPPERGYVATPFNGPSKATCMVWHDGEKFPELVEFDTLDPTIQEKVKASKKKQTVIYYCYV